MSELHVTNSLTHVLLTHSLTPPRSSIHDEKKEGLPRGFRLPNSRTPAPPRSWSSTRPRSLPAHLQWLPSVKLATAAT